MAETPVDLPKGLSHGPNTVASCKSLHDFFPVISLPPKLKFEFQTVYNFRRRVDVASSQLVSEEYDRLLIQITYGGFLPIKFQPKSGCPGLNQPEGFANFSLRMS